MNPEKSISHFEKLVFPKVSLHKDIMNSFHHATIEEIEKQVKEIGFKNVTIDGQYDLVLQGISSLQDYIRWHASSIHTVNYETLSVEILELCKHDETMYCSLYEESGQLTHIHSVYNVYCQK